MRRYAETTTVSVEKSQGELAGLLRRYGGKKTMSINDPETGFHAIQVFIRDRMLRFSIQVPPRETFTLDKYGVKRTSEGRQAAFEQEERRRWRVLILAIKAKFEEVADEPYRFDEVFLPYIVLPDNQTVAEALLPRIQTAYETGTMPRIEESFRLALPPPEE